MMRNALICAGVMLAMLLLWPLVFGGAGSAANASPTAHAASTVTMTIPFAVAVKRPTLVRAASTSRGAVGGSCRRRHDIAVRSCTTGECRQRAADGWDICEVTGFWPD